jgi:hypothetical protein
VENENLKKENAKLKEDNQALKEENQELEEQMKTMVFINEEFAKESQGYKKISERLMKKQESQKGSEFNSDEERPNPPKPEEFSQAERPRKKRILKTNQIRRMQEPK